MLEELMSDIALPAGVLAARAGVAPSTATKHLAKLQAGGLVTITPRGRLREVRLAGPPVAEAIESLGRLAKPSRATGLRQISRMDSLRRARSCYDHLAGETAIALTDTLTARGALQLTDDGFAVHESNLWSVLGLDIDSVRSHARRRPLARPCLDWTERRPHLAGALGAAILRSLLQHDWVRRRPDGRALEVTRAGHATLATLASNSHPGDTESALVKRDPSATTGSPRSAGSPRCS
jgi:DNA-binding transcriptional ArsR family regulator